MRWIIGVLIMTVAVPIAVLAKDAPEKRPTNLPADPQPNERGIERGRPPVKSPVQNPLTPPQPPATPAPIPCPPTPYAPGRVPEDRTLSPAEVFGPPPGARLSAPAGAEFHEVDPDLEPLVNSLVGWERIWEQMAIQFEEVRVEAVATQNFGDSQIVIEKTYSKKADRSRLDLRRYDYIGETRSETVQSWIFLPGETWHRVGNGKWDKEGVGQAPTDSRYGDQEKARRIVIQWQARPVEVRDLLGGMKRLILQKFWQPGRLEWEVDTATGSVVRISMLDAAGQVLWEEERRFRVGRSAAMLERRLLRTYQPVEETEREDLQWFVGPGVVMESYLVP